MGTQQSGLLILHIADIVKDSEILKISRSYTMQVLKADPKLSYGRKSVQSEEIKVLRNKRTGTLTEKDLLEMPK